MEDKVIHPKLTKKKIKPLSHEKWLESTSDQPKHTFKEQWLKPLTQKIPKSWRIQLRYLAGYPLYFFKITSNTIYDFRRFNKWSSADGKPNLKDHYKAWIIADYHKIEKALAFKNPRVGFGKIVLFRLIEHTQQYLNLYGADEIVNTAADVLMAYDSFHSKRNASPSIKGLTQTAKSWKEALPESFKSNCKTGGVIKCSREGIHHRGKLDLESFFSSRHSVRQYDPTPLDPDLIDKAIQMAQRTPSVCNRQSPKVYVYLDPEERKKVIQCQKGNAGFGNQATGVLVVTADTRAYFSVGERYQSWIDGGMLAMSLVYALHSLGMGSCCLNWSVLKQEDQALRAVTGIPDSECVIMMISVGYLPEQFVVAQSERKPLDAVRIKGLPKKSN